MKNRVSILSEDFILSNKIENELSKINVNFESFFISSEQDHKECINSFKESFVITDYLFFIKNRKLIDILVANIPEISFLIVSDNKNILKDIDSLSNSFVFSFIEDFENNLVSFEIAIKNGFRTLLSKTLFVKNGAAMSLYFEDKNSDKIVSNKNHALNKMKDYYHSFNYDHKDIFLYVAEKDSELSYSIVNEDSKIKEERKKIKSKYIENIETLLSETFLNKRAIITDDYETFYFKSNTSDLEVAFVFCNLKKLTFISEILFRLILSFTGALLISCNNEKKNDNYYLDIVLSMDFDTPVGHKENIIKDLSLFDYVCSFYKLKDSERDKVFFKCVMISIKKGQDGKYLDVKKYFSFDDKFEKIIDSFYSIKEHRSKKEDLINN